MDTQTVIDIIKMIDTKRKSIKKYRKTIPHYNQDETQYWDGMLDGYFELRQHLQYFVESELNIAENQTVE